MEPVDENTAPAELEGVELVGLAQDPAHVGQVGAAEEGGEEPGKAGLGRGAPTGQDQGCGQSRKEGLGGQFHGQGPRGPLQVRPQGEQGQGGHAGQGDQEAAIGEASREDPEGRGRRPEQQKGPELRRILLLVEEPPKRGAAQEGGQGRERQAAPREAGPEEPAQGQGETQHEPAAMFGREEAAQGGEAWGHFGIRCPKYSLPPISASEDAFGHTSEAMRRRPSRASSMDRKTGSPASRRAWR